MKIVAPVMAAHSRPGVAAADAQRHPHFSQEPIEPLGVVFDFRGEELQRHRLTELQVIGAVDLAHAAAAEQADHPVPAGDDSARQELALCGGARTPLQCRDWNRRTWNGRIVCRRGQRLATGSAEALRGIR